MSELLKDANLVKANGDKADASTLTGKLVALYFSVRTRPTPHPLCRRPSLGAREFNTS